MTVMQALSVGGGVTQRGTDKSVQVRRRDASAQYSVTKASLIDRVQQDDVIFVKESLF
jgi:polysaccharide export outer membrane protein